MQNKNVFFVTLARPNRKQKMNCLIIDDDKLSCKILEEFVKKTGGLELKGVFYNPIEALNSTHNLSDIDLVFLDVELPEMTGIDILSSTDSLPKVIVISSNKKYAVDAFDFNVSDFLLKPIKYPRFLKAIKKTQPNEYRPEEEKVTNDGIFIKKNNSFIRVNYKEICFIESVENYISFQTIDGKHIIHQTLKSIEAKLPQNFWRVHRSYIVNINNVKIIEDNNLLIASKNEVHKIPIGKVYKESVFSGIISLK